MSAGQASDVAVRRWQRPACYDLPASYVIGHWRWRRRVRAPGAVLAFRRQAMPAGAELRSTLLEILDHPGGE